jgi:hypothetical protein
MTQHHQLVCARKDVCCSGQIGNGLDDVDLIKKFVCLWEAGYCAQAQDMTSVPFKGWITKEGIAKEGKVNLVLKIYDQANGGTKLYEGVHEAEVTHGQYFAIVQVPSETIANSQLVWLEAASVDEKEVALEPRLSFTARPQAQIEASQHFRYAFLCYSCGVYAFAGSIPVPSGNPAENPAGCFPGPIAIRTDYRPYLCQYPYP